MEGRRADALKAAEDLRGKMHADMLRDPGMGGMVQHFHLTPLFVKLRFQMWDEILADAGPPADVPYMRAMWYAVRGMALAARGERAGAEQERAAVAELKDRPELKTLFISGVNTASGIVAIAHELLQADIARSRGLVKETRDFMASAAALEDGLTYMEPPDWPIPVRQLQGAALLELGRAPEAEAAFGADMKKFPENGWSLSGLQASLERQGRRADAADVRARLERAWGGADTALMAARPRTDAVVPASALITLRERRLTKVSVVAGRFDASPRTLGANCTHFPGRNNCSACAVPGPTPMDLRDLVTAEASDFTERLTAALTAQVDAATRHAQEEAEAALQKIRAELQQARAALDKARAESEQARGAAEKSRAETEQFRGALGKSRNNEKTLAAAVEKLRGDHSTLQAAIDKYRMDEKARQETISRLQNSEKSLQSTVSKLQASEKSLQAALDKLRSEESALQTNLDKARADSKGLQSTIERLQASEKSLQASLDKLQGSEKATQSTISKLPVVREGLPGQAGAGVGRQRPGGGRTEEGPGRARRLRRAAAAGRNGAGRAEQEREGPGVEERGRGADRSAAQRLPAAHERRHGDRGPHGARRRARLGVLARRAVPRERQPARGAPPDRIRFRQRHLQGRRAADQGIGAGRSRPLGPRAGTDGVGAHRRQPEAVRRIAVVRPHPAGAGHQRDPRRHLRRQLGPAEDGSRGHQARRPCRRDPAVARHSADRPPRRRGTGARRASRGTRRSS